MPAANDRVPAEFIGQARAFRAALLAEDMAISAHVDAIAAPLRARFRRKRTPRSSALTDAARLWRTNIPAIGRLSVSIKLERTRLEILEVRASATELTRAAWQRDVLYQPAMTMTL
jgi:hypothetical protein